MNVRASVIPIAALLLAAPLAALAANANESSNAGQDNLSGPVLAVLRGSAPPEAAAPALPATDALESQVTTDGSAQNEPATAVDPTNPSNVLAAWNDYSASNGNTQVWNGIGTSHDGGATWASRLLDPNPKTFGPAGKFVSTGLQTAGVPFTHGGDPIVAFNAQGTPLVGQILFSGDLSKSGIAVQTSPDHGDHWGAPIFAALSGSSAPAGFTDKPFMRGDPNGPNFYVCWTHFTGGFGQANIYFVRSTDGLGLTWSVPMQISHDGLVQGCDIGIAPNGDVYVAFDAFNGCLTCGGTMKVVKSTDGGATFGASTTVATASPISLANSAFRYSQFPRIAVTTGGTVAVAWAEGTGQIQIATSTNGGATFGAKHVVNNDGTGRVHYFPSLAPGPGGKLVAGFYDRREDATNRLAKYYFAESTDGGATFPTQYAAGASTMNGMDTKWWFQGDYTDLRIGSDGVAHAVWTAAPGTNQDVYASH